MAFSPSGEHVYVTSYNEGSLVVFQRDPATGEITFIEKHRDNDRCGGMNRLSGASAVTLNPDGDKLYVTACNDDTLMLYSRDPSTGRLTFLKKSGMGMVVLWVVAVFYVGFNLYLPAVSQDD